MNEGKEELINLTSLLSVTKWMSNLEDLFLGFLFDDF